MNRNITEFLKIPESVRASFLGGAWYNFISKLDNKSILKEKIPATALNTEKREKKVIVSLTSYPARIGYVYIAIKSLMLQTYKPDRIILWLAEEQFPAKKLPENLTALEKHGLEIIWIHDIYGHKKYFYPVLNQKENEVVITFDDDIIYSKKAIERLMKTHKKFPDCMVCERAQAYDETRPYQPGGWSTLSDVGVENPSYSLNPSPGGGCLIPYGVFHEDACNEAKIRELAYKNDDIWYMFMCAHNRKKIVKTRKYHRTFSVIEGSQIEQMAFDNVQNGKNKEIMKNLSEVYPDAWYRIVNDEE